MTGTGKTMGTAFANFAAPMRPVAADAAQASRRARYDELMARQRDTTEKRIAGSELEPDQAALGRDIWAMRKGLSPIGWCAHCAEPIYDHEPSHTAAGEIYCDRHARAHLTLTN